MVVASYIFTVTTLVKAILATTQVVHKAMDIDLSKVNELVQETGVKLPEPRLANFLDVSCQCNYTSEGSWTQLLQFNAIVFENFVTFGSQDILGRLAVGGNLMAPGYVVNSNSGEQCYGANTVPWDQLALAVGGNILNPIIEVHGHWWTAGGGTAVELNAGCNSPAKVDQPFPFSAIQTLLNDYSMAYASMAPNLVLNDDDSITDLGTLPSGCYNVMTLRPCHNSNSNNCITNGNWSFSDHILLGQPNWNGPSNGYPNLNRLLIINVPVFNGEAIDITTDQPSAGANDCNLIWNFYPADINGNYLSTGSFQLIRNTGNPFQGVTLAPSGNILDGPDGVFQGVIFANSYQWNQMNGVEIHNTPSCNGYGFCAPPGQASSPQALSSAITSSAAPTLSITSSSSAQSTTQVSSTTSVSSSSSAQSTTPVSSSTSVSSSSSVQSTTQVSSTTSVSSSSSAQSTTPVLSTTSESSSGTPRVTQPASSTASEISSSSDEPTISSSSTAPEFSSSSSESSTPGSSSVSVTSASRIGVSHNDPINSASNTQISSSTSVTSVGIGLFSISAPGRPAGTTQISSSTSSSTSLQPSPTYVSADNCRRHEHHHKNDEYEKYDDEGHAWDDEMKHEHKNYQENDDDWDYDKHKHEDQNHNENWDDDKHKHKDHQENNDDWDVNKNKHENHQKNNDGWDNDKHKRGESEDEGYWEDECEDDSRHYYDDNHYNYKDE
ncbi:hypothetical protein NQZ79_g2388 [Umbelopsis isabellina]|nr:hypothetical protein NQZ79_g2388 [Umbelopsis isabellina]